MATRLGKVTASLVAAAFVVGLSAAALAAGFEGTWKVKDSEGKPFEITLKADGTATGTHKAYKEGLKGTWKEEAGAAEIHWDTGWTTRIVKEDDTYKKSAFKPGAPLSGPPTNTSDAEKKE
jgi:uncharacterized lipoprotein NlpE involved in copper resistance